MNGTLAWLATTATVLACAEPRVVKPPEPTHHVRPSCPSGAFASEVQRLLPDLGTPKLVAFFPVGDLDRSKEPGCVIPFRGEPDDRLLYVGRVVAKIASLSKGQSAIVGRGRLEVGRRAMRLQLHNDAGDDVLSIFIDGTRVTILERGRPPFDDDVAIDGTGTLPLPVDALVAALDSCERDERLGQSGDGNIIEAKRGAIEMWRSRWADSNAIVDTTTACSPSDARFIWRTARGQSLPVFAVASARSDRVLLLFRKGASDGEEITHYGFF